MLVLTFSHKHFEALWLWCCRKKSGYLDKGFVDQFSLNVCFSLWNRFHRTLPPECPHCLAFFFCNWYFDYESVLFLVILCEKSFGLNHSTTTTKNQRYTGSFVVQLSQSFDVSRETSGSADLHYCLQRWKGEKPANYFGS